MNKWVYEACEQIDAGFFSGDTFHSRESLEEIEDYIKRWQREIENIKQMRENHPDIFND